MNTQQAKSYLKENYNELACLFETQICAPVGGFYNPSVVYADANEIEFKCHYDNFDNEEDCWSWFFDIQNREFYN